MTFKGSNWTRGELGHGVPDENPSIPCCDCDEKHPWQGYWKARVDGPDESFRCDDCKALKNRRERNQSLGEFA